MARKLNFDKVLEPEEINELLKAPDLSSKTGPRNYFIFLLMVNSGLRISEVVKLKSSDIDWKKGWLKIIGAKGRRKKKNGEALPEDQSGKDRVVPVDWSIIVQLKEWDRQRPKNAKAFFCNLRDSNYGEPMTTRNVRKLIDHYAEKANIKHVHPHMLRHTYATNLVDRGIPLEVIQELLGHEDIKTTQIYAKMRPVTLAKYIQTSPPPEQ